MSFRLERQSSSMSISSIHEANLLGKFELSPPYQRKSVWDDDRQSFFKDSLLRNYPVPPIFLKRIIDDSTGNTTFEVVDGKQRLTSIFRFIANEIPALNEDEENPVAPFNGKYFKDLESLELAGFKKNFWRYSLPVEYIDDIEEIDKIFDRLNRNGMPLNRQELRNAKFHASRFVALLREMSQLPFWINTLATIAERDRAEDIELLAEFAFVLLERNMVQAEGIKFDPLFDKWANAIEDKPHLYEPLKKDFIAVTSKFNELSLETLKIRGTSHLYGIWSLLCLLHLKQIEFPSLKTDLERFYSLERSATSPEPSIREYFAATTARTRSKVSRIKRLNALLKFLGLSVPSGTDNPFE